MSTISTIIDFSKETVLDYLSFSEEGSYFERIDFTNTNWYKDSLVFNDRYAPHIYISMLMIVFNDPKKVEDYVKEKSKTYYTEQELNGDTDNDSDAYDYYSR